MARRTDLQIVIDIVRSFDGSQGTLRRVAETLGWDIDRVRRAAERGDADHSTPLHLAQGSVLKFRGSELGSSVGVYADVMQVITRHWGPGRGLREISVLDTSKAGRRGGGVWTHPDLVVAAYPRRRRTADEPRRLHAIEVETATGFDLRSVYQAHAQGRDANYTWVIGSKAPRVDKPDWDRVLWTIEELGVGLVTFEKPHVYGTWKVVREADYHDTSPTQRASFLDRAVSGWQLEEIGSW